MKNQHIQQLLLLLALFVGLRSMAGEPATAWTLASDSKIHWHKVNALGQLLVSTDEALMSLDPTTGAEQWRLEELAGVSPGNYQEYPGTPYVSVNLKGQLYIVETFSGRIALSSLTTQMPQIDSREFLYQSGTIIVTGIRSGASRPAMVCVDAETGNLLWTLEDDMGRVLGIFEIDSERVLVAGLFTNYLLNSRSGEVIWRKANSAESQQVENLGALGAMAKAVAAQMATEMEFNIDFGLSKEKGKFFVAIEKQRQMTSSSGVTSTLYSTIYMAYDLKLGEMSWTKSPELPGRPGIMLLRGDGLLCFPQDGNKTKINSFSLLDGSGRWGKKGNGIPLKGSVYKVLDVEDQLLLMTRSGENSYVQLLDWQSGAFSFDKAVRIRGDIQKAIKTPSGVAFVTTEAFYLLDPASGNLKVDGISTRPDLARHNDRYIYIYDLDQKQLRRIDQEFGMVEALNRTALNFQGKENPERLELHQGAFVLSSDQNLARLDEKGELLYHQYLPAPREAGLTRALRYAQAIRAAYISGVSGMTGAVYQAAAKQEAGAAQAGLYDGIGQAYGELSKAAGQYTKMAWQAAQARFKASANSTDHYFMLQDNGKTHELTRLNKLNGETEWWLDIGNEREPNYALDDVGGQLILRRGNQLLGYKLQ